MAEMIIQSPDPKKKTIDYYDFTFEGGVLVPMKVDKEAGDVIDFYPDHIIVKIAPKPSLSDPKVKTGSAIITINSPRLLLYEHRTAEVDTLTPEQEAQWQQVIQEMTNTVN